MEIKDAYPTVMEDLQVMLILIIWYFNMLC